MKLVLKNEVNFKEAPDLSSVFHEVDKIAQEITIGETLFMKKYGVKSEAEYKERMVRERKIMKHSQIGWNSWDATRKGFQYIYEELEKRGSRVDRFGICIDWIMGVPQAYRDKIPAGTGLIFKTEEEWKRIGQIVPIQIHMGDHMIGSMNSLENTRLALEAGVTSIGNLSHYYTYEYPGVNLEKNRGGDVVKAIALMGKFRDRGTIIHSNLDDGFGSQFQDLVNLTGWAILERYMVEDLLGGGLGHCFGNLFSNPMVRIAFLLAMVEINKSGTYGTMVYGNTTDFGMDFYRNYGALSSFLLGDMIAQLHCPSGHAVAAIPVTEAARIPSAEEIVQANLVSDMLIEKAPLYEPYINWSKVEGEKNLLVSGGKIFFERVMNGLDDLGVDLKEPAQMMIALKNIGAAQLERCFGVGKEEKDMLNGRNPLRPTDIVQKIRKQQEKLIKGIDHLKGSLEGINIIAAATDVHEFGKEIIKNIVLKAGATVFDLKNNVTPEEIIETILETESKILVISTYNGIALSYAQELLALLEKNHLKAKIIMGGLLNENPEGGNLPVDVTKQLRDLGINADNDAEKILYNVKGLLQQLREEAKEI